MIDHYAHGKSEGKRIGQEVILLKVRTMLNMYLKMVLILIILRPVSLHVVSVVMLDFREVTFMDSSGIAIVIACVRHMRQLRGEVILRSVPPQPMKVLRASGIERIATLEDERSLVHES